MPKEDRSKLRTFRILPLLGRKVNVPADDPSLFQFTSDNVALTHDTGGMNFDLRRQPNACAKSFGYSQWSTSATGQATKCQGLFELYDGTNRDHIYYDNGKAFFYTSAGNPYEAAIPYDAGAGDFTVGLTATETTNGGTGVIVEISGVTAAGILYLKNVTGTIANDEPITDTDTGSATTNMSSPTTLTALSFATDNADLYSTIRIGAYALFSDMGEHRPYRWKNGDHYPIRLVAAAAAGENYQFRYIDSFSRRVIGLYDTTSGVSNGNISIRWSDTWPATAITALTFPAANQLYVESDDPIVGGAKMGMDRYVVYSENSISQLVYYPDYYAPFRIYTVIPGHGGVNHHSIVPFGGKHFLFNQDYGFCEYDGGAVFPSGGKPISDAIESDIAGINSAYYNLIVGKAIPFTRKIVWTVPLENSATPNRLLFYDVDMKQWTIEDKAMRYIDAWQPYSTYTWNDLITDLGGSGATWSMIGTSTTWSYYVTTKKRLVYANTDGQLYSHASEAANSEDFAGYRIEPVMDFGNKRRKDQLKEIWFDFVTRGVFSIDIWRRSGNTLGEIEAASWIALDSLSHNSPAYPFVKCDSTARLHQIKWGTDKKDESFVVNGITFKFIPGQEH